MKVIALYGIGNTGKTQTLTLTYEKFEGKEVIFKTSKKESKDFYAVFKYKGKTIGFTTQGDNQETLETPFEAFAKYNCEIVICASRVRRTNNGSVLYIENTYGAQNIIWYRQPNFKLPESDYYSMSFFEEKFQKISEIVAESIIWQTDILVK